MSSLMTDQKKQDAIPKVLPLPQTTLNVKIYKQGLPLFIL